MMLKRVSSDAASKWRWTYARFFLLLAIGSTANLHTLDGAQKWTSCPITDSPRGAVLSLKAGTTRINTNCTVPTTVVLDFSRGAVIWVNSGNTLTIQGPMIGPITQRFAGDGTVRIESAKVDVVYSQWWGALGDSFNDDTIAINAAIASLTAGGTVYFPPGKYRTTASLIMQRNVSLAGAGPQASIIQANDCDAIKFDFYSAFGNVTLAELGITGVGGTTRRAIYQAGSDNPLDELYGVTIRNNLVTHFNVGIEARSTRNWTIRDNWFEHINSGIVLLGQDFAWNITGNRMIYGDGNGSGFSDGIKLGYAKYNGGKTNVKPEGVRVTDNQIHGFKDTAIDCDACLAVTFASNDLNSRRIGFRFSETAGVVNFKDNYVELLGPSATFGILGAGQSTVLNTKVNIEGNSVISDGLARNVVGLQLDVYGVNANQTHLRIAGNAFYNFTAYDIALSDAGDVEIEGNECYSLLPASISITSSLPGRPVYINHNFLTGYIKASSPDKHSSQIVVGENGGTYSTYVRGTTTILTPATTASTTYASLLGTGAIPNFAAEAKTGFTITLHVGTPNVQVGQIWGTADKSQVIINIEKSPATSVVIPWEVKLTQCTLERCPP